MKKDPKLSKNPLNVLFGAFLVRERKKLYTSKLLKEELNPRMFVEKISQQMIISPSLYKMYESGWSTLNTNKIIPFLQVFNESLIDFEKLCKFLVAAEHIWLDILYVDGESPMDSFKKICEFDKELAKLYEKTVDLFNEDGGLKDTDLAAAEVSNFLSGQYIITTKEENFSVILQKLLTEAKCQDFTQDLFALLVKSFPQIQDVVIIKRAE